VFVLTRQQVFAKRRDERWFSSACHAKKGFGAMLVLSRRIGQRIVLPDQGVTISVLAVGKEKVRLGIVAPGGTTVHRNEVWQRICDEHAHVETVDAK
jgi:carbon storage regulator CsrA